MKFFTLMDRYYITIIVILTYNVLFFRIFTTFNNTTDHIININSNNTISKVQNFESKGEQECRYFLQKTFNKPFVNTRPSFLRNPVTGRNLELDCYNSELKLALEYNGKQHYKYLSYFHKNKQDFWNQKYRDYIKKRLCKDNGYFN